MGKRLVKDIDMSECHKNPGGKLYEQFCGVEMNGVCDDYFKKSNISIKDGIRGLASGVLRGKEFK